MFTELLHLYLSMENHKTCFAQCKPFYHPLSRLDFVEQWLWNAGESKNVIKEVVDECQQVSDELSGKLAYGRVVFSVRGYDVTIIAIPYAHYVDRCDEPWRRGSPILRFRDVEVVFDERKMIDQRKITGFDTIGKEVEITITWVHDAECNSFHYGLIRTDVHDCYIINDTLEAAEFLERFFTENKLELR